MYNIQNREFESVFELQTNYRIYNSKTQWLNTYEISEHIEHIFVQGDQKSPQPHQIEATILLKHNLAHHGI